MDSTDYRAIRIENMKKLEALGHEPFGRAFERTGTLDRIPGDAKTAAHGGHGSQLRGVAVSKTHHLAHGTDIPAHTKISAHTVV